MSVPEADNCKHGIRWVVPATAVVIGLGYLVAGIAGHQVGFGVFGLVLMLVVAGAFVLAGRLSETFAGLANRRDERINQLDQRAATLAGGVVLVAVIVMFMGLSPAGRTDRRTTNSGRSAVCRTSWLWVTCAFGGDRTTTSPREDR